MQSLDGVTFNFGPHELDVVGVAADDLLGGEFFADVLHLDVSVGVEVLLTNLRHVQELRQGILLEHRPHLRFLFLRLVLLRLLVEDWSSVSAAGYEALLLELVLEGLAQPRLVLLARHLL